LTVEQSVRLLQQRLIKTEPYRYGFACLLHWLTPSELSVLKWRDVDRKNGKLYLCSPTPGRFDWPFPFRRGLQTFSSMETAISVQAS